MQRIAMRVAPAAHKHTIHKNENWKDVNFWLADWLAVRRTRNSTRISIYLYCVMNVWNNNGAMKSWQWRRRGVTQRTMLCAAHIFQHFMFRTRNKTQKKSHKNHRHRWAMWLPMHLIHDAQTFFDFIFYARCVPMQIGGTKLLDAGARWCTRATNKLRCFLSECQCIGAKKIDRNIRSQFGIMARQAFCYPARWSCSMCMRFRMCIDAYCLLSMQRCFCCQNREGERERGEKTVENYTEK